MTDEPASQPVGDETPAPPPEAIPEPPPEPETTPPPDPPPPAAFDFQHLKWPESAYRKFFSRFKLSDQQVSNDPRLQWMIKKCCDDDAYVAALKQGYERREQLLLAKLNAATGKTLRFKTDKIRMPKPNGKEK